MKASATLLSMFFCSALLINKAVGWGFGSGSDCHCSIDCGPHCKLLRERVSFGGDQNCVCQCQCPEDGAQNPNPQLPPQNGNQPQQPPFQNPNPVPRQPPQRGNQPPVQNRPPYNGPHQVGNQPPVSYQNSIFACMRAQPAFGQCVSLTAQVLADPNSPATHNAVRQHCCASVREFATYCVGNPSLANILAMPIDLNVYCRQG